MTLSKSEAEDAVREICEQSNLGCRLDDCLRRFAVGELNRSELGLRMEMLLEDALTQIDDRNTSEGTGASHADDERKREGVA